MKKSYESLRLILGDQLNSQHSWFYETDDNVLYLIAELRQETDYATHHVQKVCGFFAAMQHFAGELKDKGHHVLYLDLDDTARWSDLTELVNAMAKRYRVSRFEYQRPDEFRLMEQLENMSLPQGTHRQVSDPEHFFLPFADLPDYFTRDSHVRMESFYRKMRRRFCILMDDDQPEGGTWNFDKENRQRFRDEDIEAIPEPLLFGNDVSAILARLQRHEVATIGTATKELVWPVNRQQSLTLLKFFCQQCLANFGRFQDAMTGQSESRWSLYHSRLSFALNCKMLSPAEVVDAAISRYRQAKKHTVTIAQVEGFVRQILGWREYVRGIYWTNMPDYATRNRLRAQRALPDFFWTGDTRMSCLRHAISQSLEFAYAHHIQRLMVTGNFALLAGINPREVDEWYLGIYMDAIEWVELPNTRGMSQYADGGLIATKPYAASGNYTNRMSDYCGSCHYQVKEKTGERSCPLNSLYWHFMVRHRDRFSGNQRIGMVYRNWDRMNASVQQHTLDRARWVLEHLDEL